LKTIAFFSPRSGIGTTTLVYHLAHSLAQLGVNTLAVDLDPQATLTTIMMGEDRHDEWIRSNPKNNITGVMGVGNTSDTIQLLPAVERIDDKLCLIPADPKLATFEDLFATYWTNPRLLNSKNKLFHFFRRLIDDAGKETKAEVALLDLGPTISAINHTVLANVDAVILPASNDLLGVEAFSIAAKLIVTWRIEWKEFQKLHPRETKDLPIDLLIPSIGYVVLQHGTRGGRLAHQYEPYVNMLVRIYRDDCLQHSETEPNFTAWGDPNCLAIFQHKPSLHHMAMIAGKPMFDLKTADGLMGSEVSLMVDCRKEYKQLSQKILKKLGIAIPE
jgi:chromosome partitioning protein